MPESYQQVSQGLGLSEQRRGQFRVPEKVLARAKEVIS